MKKYLITYHDILWNCDTFIWLETEKEVRDFIKGDEEDIIEVVRIDDGEVIKLL